LQATAALDDPVSQGGLAMVNVGNDGKITNVVHHKLAWFPIQAEKAAETVAKFLSKSHAIKKGASSSDAPEVNPLCGNFLAIRSMLVILSTQT